MPKIKIMVDSASDIPKDFVKAHDISVVPLNIIFEHEQYLDYYELTSREFFEKLRQSHHHLPKTAQPNPTAFLDRFSACEGRFDDILCFTLSSNGSGTYQSACMAAKEYNDNPGNKTRVHVFDTLQASLGVSLFVFRAVAMVKENKAVCDIIASLEKIRGRIASYFVVDTLEYLKKGGRVNTVTSLIGSLLNIHPIITVLEGWGRNYGKVRGMRQIASKLLELYEEQHANLELFISHGDCFERAVELMETFKKQFAGIQITLSELGCTMGTHAGPGTLGIFFERRDIHALPEKKLLGLSALT
jgi:DegV family protein with EDD domain